MPIEGAARAGLAPKLSGMSHRRGSPPGRAAAALLTVAVVAWVASRSLPAQTKSAPTKPPGTRQARLTDASNATWRYAFSDAAEFDAAIEGEYVRCTLTMTLPIPEGMFVCAHLYLDTDDNERTGINGNEVWVRATVGSRFRPNAHSDGSGGTMLRDVRASYSLPIRHEDRSVDWQHQNDPLAKPTVDGSKLSFAVPLSFVNKRNAGYTSVFSIRVAVETSCSDQPLDLAHVCSDEGMVIEVDGKEGAGEWSGQACLDPGDELHPATRRLDMEAFRLEHDAKSLFATVRFAEPGFADQIGQQDVRDESALTLYVDPLFPRYQDAATLHVRVGSGKRDGRTQDGQAWQAAMVERTLELRLARRTGQTRFRVFAWSDYRCVDDFADRMRLDWTAK